MTESNAETQSKAQNLTVEDLLEGADSFAESVVQASEEAGSSEEVVELLDDIEDVIDELEDMIENVDLADLLAAIDWENLPEAIDVGDIPEAIEDRDPGEAIALNELISMSDMPEVWENVNAREFWRQYREFDDEVDDLSGDDGSVNDVMSDGEDDSGGSSDDDSGGLLSDDDDDSSSLLSDDDDDSSSLLSDDDADGDGSLGGISQSGEGIDSESIENTVEYQVADAIDEFRESLIEARNNMKRQLEDNRAENEKRIDSTNSSRNPTAVSTMPRRNSSGGAALFSTVPIETKYSTAPNRKRIYGNRFEEADDDG